MTDPQLGVLMLVLFIFLIMLGFPIAFTLMAMGVGFAFLAYDGNMDAVASLLVQRTWSVMTNDVLISVPLFVFMGYIIERANILDRLFRSIQLASGGLPGSLAIATLVTCALFATATGIVGAVVTLMGLLAFPAMLRHGYDVKLSAGVVCAGGCLGILIPPSIMLILYGATAGVSPVQLYAGAFFPGLMLTGIYMALCDRSRIAQSIARAAACRGKSATCPLSTIVCRTCSRPSCRWRLLILSVLGAIMFGLATPSEAAAIGALGAVMLAAAYRSLTFQKLKELVFLTARTSAMVGWLFVGSFTFSAVFADSRRRCGDQGFCRRPRSVAADVPDRQPDHHLHSRLAARMDRDHRHIRADLPAAARSFRHRSVVLRTADRAQHPDLVPVAAGGNGAVLP